MGPVTLQQLQKICRKAPVLRLGAIVPDLNRAMSAASINTPLRQAAFLAQLAHESGEFRYTEELADGSAYEGRHDLGNNHPGDGKRFKGRGFIQLTGRGNYRAAGQALGIDLEQHPEQAAQIDTACQIAAWYWTGHGLNELADSRDFERITRRINGGLNGQPERLTYYHRALIALDAIPTSSE